MKFIYRNTLLVILICSITLLYQTPTPGFQHNSQDGNQQEYFNFRFKHFKEESGLSQKSILSILQDSESFLWLGTNKGLVRYDGYVFHTFENVIGDSTSLSNNTVNCIFEDSRGWLWIGTNDGLNRFDRYNEGFLRITSQNRHPEKSSQMRIFSLTEDAEGTIWAGTGRGVMRIHFGKNDTHSKVQTGELSTPDYTISRYIPNVSKLSEKQNIIHKILIDKHGNIWVGSFGGFMRLIPEEAGKTAEGGKYKFERIYENYGSVAPNLRTPALNLLEDHSGKIWVKTSMGLVSFEPPLNPNKPINGKKHFKNYSYEIYLYRTGAFTEIKGENGYYLWMELKDKGFAIFDPLKEKFHRFTGEETGASNSSLPYLINSIYKDRNNLIWFGTNTNGLFKYDIESEQFNKYNYKLNKIIHKDLVDLRFVFEDSRGDLWIANDGLYRCDRNTGSILSEYWTNTATAYWTFKNKIEEDGLGYVWIASEFGGLYRYDPFNDKMSLVMSFGFDKESKIITGSEVEIRSYSANDIRRAKLISKNKGFYTENVTALAKDNKGNIWAAAWVDLTVKSLQKDEVSGMFIIYKIDIKTQKIHRYRLDEISSFDIANSFQTIYSIYIENSESLWLGTGSGLFNFNPQSGNMKELPLAPDQIAKLNSISIHAITPDEHHSHKYLWLGTANKGLFRFDKDEKTFIQYTKKNGLPGNIVSSVLSDNKGNLWLGTNKGLSNLILDKNTSQILDVRNFDESDGIKDDDFGFFYGQNAHKNSKGEMFFAGAKDISIFDPEEIKTESVQSPLVPTAFYINFKPIFFAEPESPLTTPVSKITHIELPYSNNSFAIDLAVLNFRSPEKNRYMYKLSGFQDEWVKPGNSRKAIFTRVPPGDYIFKAKAFNTNGSIKSNELVINLSIIPPWYLTWWAYILYGISFFGLLYVIRKYELNRQMLKITAQTHLAETDRLKEIDKMKTDFFTNISHEFRTPLSLIKGPVEQELQENKNPITGRRMKMALRNINRLFFLIKQLLDLSALESNKTQLRTSKADIVSYLNGNIMGFASWVERKNINLKIYSKEEHIDLYFDKDQMEKIINNLLSNAIKFTNEGGAIEVTIGLSEDKKSVEIVIKDTGVGIPENKLPHIFDRFYQADTSETKEHEGTGIGLALAKELVELHNGKISVESKEGVGTIFTLSFPLGKEHLKPSQIMASINETKKVSKVSIDEFDYLPDDGNFPNETIKLTKENQPLILIVEDHADFRTFIGEILEDDYRTIEAKNGLIGLERAIDEIPDLIISDVMMPEMSGYELCEKIKNDERTCHIPVILLTAKAAQKDRLQGLSIGADDYLSKPFESKELLTRVNNLISQRRKLQVYFQQHILIKTSGEKIISAEEEFVQRALKIVEENIGNEDFSVDDFAGSLNMSRSQLHRKIIALTGKSATSFIRTIRLQHAAELLKAGSGNVTEIAFDVGFSSQSYFTRCFAEQFGCSPSEYKRRHG